MPYKVYLADDSITIQKVVELTLSEEDFEVTAFGDGQSALDAARKAAPDIILADIVMPRMDGYQLSMAVKQDPALKNTPVVLLAGTFENFDVGLAASSFADGHIIKPFESSELIKIVKGLVEAKAAQVLDAEPLEPLEEAVFAEEVLDADPVDDLWSVVDMQSPDQPLAGATEVISEEELWARANLLSEPGRPMPAPPVGMAGEVERAVPAVPAAPDEGMPWDDLPVDAVMEEEGLAEAFLADDDDSIFLAEEAPEEEMALEAEPTAGLPEAGQPSADDIHKLVEAKVREIIANTSPDIAEKVLWEVMPGVAEKIIWEVVPAIVEKIVWEVVPGLAEDIIRKEIEELKAG
ncbi:MAG: response regulator [Nitrospirota bacterium]